MIYSHSEFMKELWKDPEYRVKQTKGHKPRRLSKQQIEAISKANSGSGNGNWKPKVSFTCPICGESFKITIYQASKKTRRKFCSRKCADRAKMGVTRPKWVGEKISKGQQGRIQTKETREKISKSSKGKTKTEDFKEKQRRIHLGKTQSSSCIAKRRISLLKKWRDLSFARNQVAAMRRGARVKPTSIEKLISKLLRISFPNRWKYVGDGSFIIGRKNPDFININDGQKKIIEVFGNYWHSKRVTGNLRKTEEQQRIKYFWKYGYQTLVIWEDELVDKAAVRSKIAEFSKDD